MRAAGYSFTAIAETLGYTDPSGASKAYHRALRRRPDQSVDEIRAQESERLEYLWRATARQIEDPGPRTSAIGKVVMYPAGHERAGEPVPDESVRTRAIHEYRMQSESYRRLTGADLTPAEKLAQDQADITEWQVYVSQIVTENAAMKQRLAELEHPRVTVAAITA